MLQDRLLNRPSAGLEIVVESIGDRIPRVDLSESAVDSWLDSERARLLAPLEADVEERRQRGERVTRPLTPDERRAAGPAIDLLNSLRKSGDLARFQHALGQGYVPEDRDDDDYRQEVEEYISRARGAVAAAAYNEFGASDGAALELRVVNTSDRNLEDVEVVVTFPGAVMSFEEVDADFPKRPRTWGPRAHSALAGLAWDPSRLSLGNYPLGPFATPGYIAKNHGSTTIEFDPFHLRPHKSFDLDPVPLVVAAAESGSLTGSWVATARNRDGRAEGTVTVPLDERVFSIGDLLRRRGVGPRDEIGRATRRPLKPPLLPKHPVPSPSSSDVSWNDAVGVKVRIWLRPCNQNYPRLSGRAFRMMLHSSPRQLS